MSVKWEKEEGTNNGKLTFEIEPAKIKEGLDTAFNRVKKTLNVPGFRKGKVPRQIFNKMFGEESLYQDALNAVLPEAYANAVAESNIKPVAQPEIDVESMEKDSTWVLTAKVTVEPEVKLGQYKDLEVKARSTEVTDEEVDAEIKKLTEEYKMSEEEFLKLFPEAKEQGKSFEVFCMYNCEFALARKETKSGKGHKEFKIETKQRNG